jgi:spore coat polysaccharide biosynthesis protein SpsF
VSKTIALVQARMESTRLPGKVLMPILGRPVLWHIVHRLRAVPAIDMVAVVTSERQANDAIRDFAAAYDTPCFSGSEEDVLDRFHEAAEKWEGDPLIRVTADCPLVDPEVVGNLIALFNSSSPRLDLAAVATGAGVESDDFKGHRFPDGLDAEVVAFGALERAWKEATLPSDREHVTPYIWRQPDSFKIEHLMSSEGDLSNLRWTIDYPEDLTMVTRIYEALYDESRPFVMHDVLAFLKSNPEVAALNGARDNREGYRALWREAADR